MKSGVKKIRENHAGKELSFKELRNFFQQVSVGIAQTDLHGNFILVNEMFSKITGRSSAELYGMSWQELLYRDDLESYHKMFQKMMDEGQSFTTENRIICPDGSVWVSSDISLVQNHLGEPQYVNLVIRDITIRKQAEEAQAHFLELSRMDLERLRSEREIREKFVATLTHDLRNPLIIARMSAQLVLHHKDKPEYQERLNEMVISSIDRADQMIQNLLDANRIRAGQKLPINVVNCELRSIIREALEGLNKIYGERCVLQADHEILGYWCCQGIRRVIENLVSNAIKYGSLNTPITITLSEANQKVKIAVHNEGKELSSQEQRTIFEPFQRSKSADQGKKIGWGLGLTLVSGIAEAHGGNIQLQSAKDQGTTFIVELPIDSRPYQNMKESEE